jgi:CubicO group peptidase (beta-lactamase class C family)
MIKMRNNGLIFLIFFLIILSCNDKSLKVSDHNSNTHFKDTLNIKIKFIENDKRKGKIESFFQKKFKQRQFNGNILFAENDQIIMNKSYGFANFQEKEKLTQNHSFQLASVSKPFTAIAILQLIENGILTLNDTVEKFLPNFPYEGITIHQLLSHRSGLSQYTHFCDSPDSIWPDKNKTINNNDVIEIISKIKPLKNYPPDRRYYYCNTNFLLLASIVEKVTGITFREYLKSNIFSPLGMNHTVLYDRTNFEELILPTQGYENRTPWEDVYLNGVVGDKGIYSTTLDMFLFDQALNQNILINDSLKKLAFSKMNKDYHQNKNYGYGFRLKTHKKFGKIVYHTGWWKGYRSYFIKIPESNQTIIVLNNVKRGRFLNINQLIELIN